MMFTTNGNQEKKWPEFKLKMIKWHNFKKNEVTKKGVITLIKDLPPTDRWTNGQKNRKKKNRKPTKKTWTNVRIIDFRLDWNTLLW